jgi:hypothetical protein
MKLIHNEQIIGQIEEEEQDGPWMSGQLAIEQDVPSQYWEFFNFMTRDGNFEDPPPFGEELLDEKRWFVVSDGQLRGIEVPAVHDGDYIMWQWC